MKRKGRREGGGKKDREEGKGKQREKKGREGEGEGRREEGKGKLEERVGQRLRTIVRCNVKRYKVAVHFRILRSKGTQFRQIIRTIVIFNRDPCRN